MGMNKLRDKTSVVASIEKTPTKAARAPWSRPSFRALSARETEIGVDVDSSDGAFTTS
jgi:hypothetical protein